MVFRHRLVGMQCRENQFALLLLVIAVDKPFQNLCQWRKSQEALILSFPTYDTFSWLLGLRVLVSFLPENAVWSQSLFGLFDTEVGWLLIIFIRHLAILFQWFSIT
jgi:hypothetical protein